MISHNRIARIAIGFHEESKRIFLIARASSISLSCGIRTFAHEYFASWCNAGGNATPKSYKTMMDWNMIYVWCLLNHPRGGDSVNVKSLTKPSKVLWYLVKTHTHVHYTALALRRTGLFVSFHTTCTLRCRSFIRITILNVRERRTRRTLHLDFVSVPTRFEHLDRKTKKYKTVTV